MEILFKRGPEGPSVIPNHRWYTSDIYTKKTQKKIKKRSPTKSFINLLSLHILAIIYLYVMLFYIVPPTYTPKNPKKNQKKIKKRSPNESSISLLSLHILAIIYLYVMLFYIVPSTYTPKNPKKNQKKNQKKIT